MLSHYLYTFLIDCEYWYNWKHSLFNILYYDEVSKLNSYDKYIWSFSPIYFLEVRLATGCRFSSVIQKRFMPAVSLVGDAFPLSVSYSFIFSWFFFQVCMLLLQCLLAILLDLQHLELCLITVLPWYCLKSVLRYILL